MGELTCTLIARWKISGIANAVGTKRPACYNIYFKKLTDTGPTFFGYKKFETLKDWFDYHYQEQ
jgi:hypothetical protein